MMSLAEVPDEPESLLLTPECEHLEPDTPRNNKKYYLDDSMSIFLVSRDNPQAGSPDELSNSGAQPAFQNSLSLSSKGIGCVQLDVRLSTGCRQSRWM
jgi:hypothetical protein